MRDVKKYMYKLSQFIFITFTTQLHLTFSEIAINSLMVKYMAFEYAKWEVLFKQRILTKMYSIMLPGGSLFNEKGTLIPLQMHKL